jgi:translation initiation factor IF-1
MHRDAVQIEGCIVEAHPNRTFQVELANGHRLLAFLPKRWRTRASAFGPGQKVIVEVSPFDLSKGRLAVTNK